MTESTVVLVYTRQALLREGLRHVLPAGHEVIESPGDNAELLEMTARLQPDVLILDSVLTGESVDALADALRAAAPSAKLIVLNGAHGSSGSPHCGVHRIDSRLADTELLAALGASTSPAVVLTERQKQILRSVAQGKASKEIAAELQVSIKTIEFHRSRIMQKLDMHTVAQLARFAAARGLV